MYFKAFRVSNVYVKDVERRKPNRFDYIILAFNRLLCYIFIGLFNFFWRYLIMFLYNIAYSLEFIVVALGAFLIGWGRYKCYKNKMIVRPIALAI